MAYKDKSKMIEYINRYNAQKYDRISVMLPIGQKETVKSHAESRGERVNAFVKRAIAEQMRRDNERAGD